MCIGKSVAVMNCLCLCFHVGLWDKLVSIILLNGVFHCSLVFENHIRWGYCGFLLTIPKHWVLIAGFISEKTLEKQYPIGVISNFHVVPIAQWNWSLNMLCRYTILYFYLGTNKMVSFSLISCKFMWKASSPNAGLFLEGSIHLVKVSAEIFMTSAALAAASMPLNHCLQLKSWNTELDLTHAWTLFPVVVANMFNI